MKFTIDTKTKTITLLEKCSFTELEQIKAFIGLDISEWSVEAKTITVKEKEYIGNWWNNWGWRYAQNPWASIVFGSGSGTYQSNQGNIGLADNPLYKGDLNSSIISVTMCPNKDNTAFLCDSNFLPKGTLSSYTN